jgi:peptidoglycan/LPS O-acetylase OafA/YrhL
MPGHIKELDGLRGVLALWVFVSHALLYSGAWDALPTIVARFGDGTRAVDVFIILSGFVIGTLLVQSREPFIPFITRRFLRLFPVLVVCLLAALLAQSLGLMPKNYNPGMLGPQLLTHLTMLHGAVPDWLLPNSANAILDPAWSVSLEWQFYLVAPFLVAALGGGERRFLLASLLCIAVYRLMAPHIPVGYPCPGAFLPFNLHLFWIGLSCALIYRRAMRNQLYRAEKGLLLGIVMAAFLVLPYSQCEGPLLWLAIFAALLGAIPLQASRWPLLVLRSPPLLALGRISYPVYLSHAIWLLIVMALLAPLKLSAYPLAGISFALSLPLVLASSYALHRWIEAPAIRFGKTIAQRRAVTELQFAGWSPRTTPHAKVEKANKAAVALS